MTYSTNLPEVINTVHLKLSKVHSDELTRTQAVSLMAVMKDRIHVQGKDSNGNQIGTYTPAYVKYVRAKKHKRGFDNKVILSLTRQMESGYQIEAIKNGYAICFRTAEDMQKARWCEETYKKPIFAPTAEEKAMVIQIAQDYISKHF
jgi:hypothetical protein